MKRRAWLWLGAHLYAYAALRCLSFAVASPCPRKAGNVGELTLRRQGMPRDLLRRPPLRASELPPNRVSLYPGEARAVMCPGCDRWQVPHNGGLRRHTVHVDSETACSETGRRVWFDLSFVAWRALLEAAVRDAALRHGRRVYRGARPPAAPPLFRITRAT